MSKIHTYSCCCTWLVSPKLCTPTPIRSVETQVSKTHTHSCCCTWVVSPKLCTPTPIRSVETQVSKIHTHSCCCTWVVPPKLCTRFPNLTTIDTTTQGHNCYFVLILSAITGQIDKVYSQCMVIQTSRSRIWGI